MKKVRSIEFIDNLKLSVPSGRSDFESMPVIPENTICTVIEEEKYMGRIFYNLAEYQSETGKTIWWYPAQFFTDISGDMWTKQEENAYTNPSLIKEHTK